MILIDTGPLVVLLNKNDPYHNLCNSLMAGLSAELLLTTCWPCFTEAMYFLGRAGEFLFQIELWHLYQANLLQLWNADDNDCQRMQDLMQQYQDQPMDLADASLVVAAESTGIRDLFTLDRHFSIYQLQDGTYLNVVS